MDSSRLQYLVRQYLNDACTPEEIDALWKGLQDLEDGSSVEDTLQPLWDASKKENDTPPLGWQHTLNRIHSAAGEVRQQQAMILKRRHRIQRWAVAASVILIIGSISYFSFLDSKTIIHASDIKAPQNSKATITLADGKQVYLDSMRNGQLAKVGNIKLVKLANGQIAYQTADGQVLKELQYNTLTNPKGSRVADIQLSDGSHVWLNAGSAIRYPVAFVGNERKVELNGEGYFEIAHNESKPFYVSKGGVAVKVLGTHFNVNAYEDESNVTVTLLEGKVQVNAGPGKEVKLSPGQQAVATGTNVSFQPKVDIDAVMSWKNNIFDFNHVDLATVLRQVARWYDLDIVYEGEVPTIQFIGKIQRDLNLSEVLEGLKQTGVDFRMEGKKLIVLN